MLWKITYIMKAMVREYCNMSVRSELWYLKNKIGL